MDFLAVVFATALTWYVIKKTLVQGVEKEEKKYTLELSETIEKIYKINKKIENIMNLLTDIETSDGDNLKNITLDWQTVTGKSLTADVWIDGKSEVTEQMRILANKRLEELTNSLFAEIEKLQNAVEKA